MVVHQLNTYKQVQTTNTKNISDRYKMTISQLRYLQTLTITLIIQTAPKLPLLAILHGEAAVLKFL